MAVQAPKAEAYSMGACVPLICLSHAQVIDVPPLLECPSEVWHADWWGGGIIGWSLNILGLTILRPLRQRHTVWGHVYP